jgi:hypothetical protein
MLTFARFWRARDRLQWKVAVSRTNAILTVKSAEAAHGVTFDFDRRIESVDAGATLLADGHRVVLPDLLANEPVNVQVQYARFK